MKPMADLFRMAAAGICLVNEWRDSLSYLSVGVVAGSAALQGYPLTAIGMACVSFIGTREFVRTVAWVPYAKAALAGVAAPRVSAVHAALAAAFVANATFAGEYIGIGVLAEPGPYNIAGLCAGTHAAVACASIYALNMTNSSLKDIPRIYSSIWDWARKHDGGGGTTRKLRNTITSWAGSFAKHRPAMSARVTPHSALSRS